MRGPTILFLITSTCLAAGCGDERSGGRPVPVSAQVPDKPAGPAAVRPAGTRSSFAVRELLSGLDVPVQVITRPQDDRLFVVEQAGLVRVVEGDRVVSTPYLDLTDRVKSGGELGLLTATFSPDGSRLTTMWTDKRLDTRVTRYVAGQVRAERDAEEQLLRVDQPSDYDNHKGGTLLHDADGGLLLGLGDGGSAFDPGNRSQHPRSPLGKVLRHDGVRWSVVARGLRNPYRMSLDAATERLWIGDVGQDRVEEIDAITLPEPGAAPPNLGWPAYEGAEPVGRKRLTGTRSELVWPLVQYGHGTQTGKGCSVTGGLVHRGRGLPRLRGRYLFADFCSGQLWSAAADGAEDPGRLDLRYERGGPLAQVTSFAGSDDGRIVATTADGRLHELISDR